MPIDIRDIKVTINDKDALMALSFVQVKAYLILHGWKEKEPDTWSFYVYSHHHPDGNQAEVLIGKSDKFGDHPHRVHDAIRLAAEIEDRSQLLVYEEISLMDIS